MTQDAFNRGNEIMNKIKELKEALSVLEYRAHRRKKDIKEHKADRSHWIPIPNWFSRGVAEKKKVILDIPIELYHRLEFELDEECVEFIIYHQKEKIKALEKELEAL